MVSKFAIVGTLIIWVIVVSAFADDARIWFEATFIALLVLVIFLDQGWGMLRDQSTALVKPFSFSRVQLAWWSCIIIAALIGIMKALNKFPAIDGTTLVLLGISGGTTTGAAVIDASDRSNSALRSPRHQNQNSENLLLDILSDADGVSIHRFQAVIFNIAFGAWFINQVIKNLAGLPPEPHMPVIDINCLALLGISSGTYAAVKTIENK